MKTQNNTINCPKCGTSININDIIYQQLRDEFTERFNSELSEEKNKLHAESSLLEKEKMEITRQKEALKKSIDEGVKKGIKTERQKISEEIRKQLEDETLTQIETMQTELQRKSVQLKDLNKTKAEVERLKRENDEIESSLRTQLEIQLNEQLQQEKEKLQKAVDEKANMKLSEKEQVIDQLKKQLQEAQRKAEQGSMQLQGEVQELAIENWLKEHFPLDSIEEIKKGANGADCLQIVNTRSRKNCGSIYYESKRTKSFQPSWIEKFKNDIREKGANIGVLVTEVMPNDMERMGLKDGIWICSFEEFKGFCLVLRESLIQIHNAIATQENKGDKMVMLYDFLTSNEFRLHIEAIVEGFVQMKSDLDSEKRSIQSIWKKREKQIDKVILNTNHLYSSIKGIAGGAIQPIAQLELSVHEE